MTRGPGKSYLTALFIAEALARGQRVIVFNRAGATLRRQYPARGNLISITPIKRSKRPHYVITDDLDE